MPTVVRTAGGVRRKKSREAVERPTRRVKRKRRFVESARWG